MEKFNEYSLLTTKQAAQLIHVHESSIKRWCKDGLMVHHVTGGGHRRIHIDDLLEFARHRSLSCQLAGFSEAAPEVWSGLRLAQTKSDVDRLFKIGYGWLRQPALYLFKRLVAFCMEQGMSFSEAFDAIIARTLRQIGDDWHENVIDIGTEHYMTEIVRDLLHDIRLSQADQDIPFPKQKAKNGTTAPRKAIIGCNEGNRHDMGAQAIRLILEQQDWDVIYLGADVPASEFAAMQHRHNAKLLCISFVTVNMMSTAARIIDVLSKFYDDARPYHLAVGGHAFPTDATDTLVQPPFLDVGVYRTTIALSKWLEHHKLAAAA